MIVGESISISQCLNYNKGEFFIRSKSTGGLYIICSYDNLTGDDCVSANRQRQASVNFHFRTNHRSVYISASLETNYNVTHPSRPNKVGLKCPSARPYVRRPSVRPQKVSSISMTFSM